MNSLLNISGTRDTRRVNETAVRSRKSRDVFLIRAVRVDPTIRGKSAAFQVAVFAPLPGPEMCYDLSCPLGAVMHSGEGDLFLVVDYIAECIKAGVYDTVGGAPAAAANLQTVFSYGGKVE